MRLFIALNFENEVKKQISDIIEKVESSSIQGKFLKEEHMHLTVEFLGEIQEDQVDLIKNIMDQIEFKAFTLRPNKLGYFKRREGNIYWLGLEKNNTLMNIHEALHQRLIDNGFELEDREYRPHITIGRKVKIKDPFPINEINDGIKKIEINIDCVDLMKSEFKDGKLIYSLLHSKQLH
ncbi:MAG: RNA 2',3'-cyclic phosphodiesterase [Anaerovoracaceae bacterium]|jgi:2'-5' RNA ligase